MNLTSRGKVKMMNKRAAFILGIIAIIAVIAVYSMLPYMYPEELPPPLPDMTSIPGVPFAYEVEEKVFIDVGEAADGKAYEQSNSNIEYDDDAYWLVLIPSGMYMGDSFSTEYKDEDEVVKMRITDTLDHKNGIIEGWMTFDIRNDIMYVSIFLDRDWKSNVGGKTNIIWGDDLDNIREFEWDSISQGIYMDEISFPAGHLAGRPSARINLLVSNATLEFFDFPEAFKDVVGFGFE